MREAVSICVILLVLGNSTFSPGQGIELSGSIIDAESKEPIPFANIALKDVYKGTASNALGDFSFKVDSLPIVLVVTHLSYEPLEVEVNDSTILTIALIPGKLLMNELVIKGRGNSKYSYDLIKNAYYNISGQSGKSRYGKAFYRQISKNGDEYSELYEIFYDTRYSMNGVEDWAVQEGRYALKLSTADSFIYNKNFTLMVRLLNIVQPKTEDLIMPVSERVEEQYDLNLEQILYVNNREVAQIRFTKQDYVSIPAMEGIISIDVKSYDVLKLQGQIVNDDLNFITLKGDKGSWKNYKVSFEIGFKPLDDDMLALDYMLLGQNFDYYYDGVFANQVETRSFLSYYEYYKPPKRKKLGGRLLRFNKRDSDLLDNIGYNQSFWDDNIIVKRTPVEAEVIASFEEERAFGSIYLNNKNQIVLEDYEIDNDPFIVKTRDLLKNYHLPRYGEKVYLHIDKPYYAQGEKIWIKSYVVSMANNLPVEADALVSVDLLSPAGDVIKSVSFLTRAGFGNGQMNLPVQLGSGEYTLRAYSEAMRRYPMELLFHKKLEIYNYVNNKQLFERQLLDTANVLKFYPEGGKVIESLPMQIGFLAKNKYGDPLEIKGKLIGEEGRQIAALRSEEGGPGSIFLMPKSGYEYQPMISSHDIQRIEFPEVEKSGYVVMINNLKPNTIDISVRGTMNMEGDKFYVLIISNGILYDRRIGALTRGLYKAEIPKANLPSGIAQILLVDEAGTIHSKRLVHVNQPEEVVVRYYVAKRDFRRRDRIDLVIDLQDQNGKSVNDANVSISVLDKDKVSVSEHGRNIRSYFNLGYLADNLFANEGKVISSDDRESLKIIDFMMLSQQSFVPQIETFDSLQNIKEVLEHDQSSSKISGVIRDADTGENLDGGTLKIICYPNTSKGFVVTSIDEQGRFEIDDDILGDSVEVLIKVADKNDQSRNVTIGYDDFKSIAKSEEHKTEMAEIPEKGINYIEKRQIEIKDLVAQPDEPSARKQNYEFRSNHGTPDAEVLIDEKYSKNSDLIEMFDDRFPNIVVTGKGEDLRLRVRGNRGTPLILVDGLSINELLLLEKTANETDKDQGKLSEATLKYLTETKPEAIARIEIFKNAAGFSEHLKNSEDGLVCIYSREGRNQYIEPGKNGLSRTWIKGPSYPEKFISPEYIGQDEGRFKPDTRTTLYWNPEVRTNRRGRAKIGFYNSDDARNIQICVEGITSDGLPIFDVQELGRDTRKERVN